MRTSFFAVLGLTSTSVLVCLTALGCGGPDPLHGGGGDPLLLRDAGSACSNFTATAPVDLDAGPYCGSPNFHEDPACDAWVNRMLPPGWPIAAWCYDWQCTVQPTGNGTPACKTGAAGDAYCSAWASQFVRGAGTALESCVGFEANNVNGWCEPRELCGATGCDPTDSLCVERVGKASCENACQ
jgi:hypothetical protein